MDKRSSATSGTPRVSLEVSGTLTLKGWDDLEVLAKCPTPEDLTMEQHDDEVVITCQGDCTVRVPFGAILQVNNVSGHATLKSLEGDLVINKVSGHLTLRSIGSTTIHRVSGHLTAKNVNGDLMVSAVDGNATIRDVQGNFIVENSIQGNLTLNDIDGDARVVAEGNATISLDPAPGNSYNFKAGGNLLCRIPADASVQVEVSGGSSILVKIPGVDLPSPIRAPYSVTLGEGDAMLTLSAGGNTILASLPPDWDMEDVESGADYDQVAESISQQIDAQMEMLEHQLESQLDSLSTLFKTSNLSPEQAEQITKHATEESERATARAQEKVQRAQEKLKRKLEAARRRAEMKARTAERAARDRRKRYEPFDWSPPPSPTTDQPVTDEERLIVLQMLEQQKITIEEAEQLLAALEVTASGD